MSNHQDEQELVDQGEPGQKGNGMKIDIRQINFIELKLREILIELERRLGELVITSLYRINDSGVHGTMPLRGVDLRHKCDYQAQQIESYVNGNYVYDYQRPDMRCCLIHNVGRGKHIHLQVHPNTIRKTR